MRRFGEDYVRGLGMATHNNALAYGYSVTVGSAFALLSTSAGPADVGHVFAFLSGSAVAFAVVNALVTNGFRRRVEQEPPVVLALATSFSVLSISGGAGVALLIGWALGGWISWLLGALLATWAYLSIAALEVAAARLLHLSVSDEDPENR
ncbi:MAG: hypothetical protein JWM60_1621 [Solirubrobacterales bacterium]|nr:hypothetical protein [Solirubrobacterales bacterium]